MNDLSWIIYAADAVPAVGETFGVFAAVLAIFGSLGIWIWSMLWMNDEAPKPIYKTFATALLVCSIFSALTPSRETILMIAASELGETVATSEEGAQALDDIRTIVTDELARLAGREQ